MLILLKDGKISLQSIEKASKPFMKVAESIGVKTEPLQFEPNPLEIPYEGSDIVENENENGVKNHEEEDFNDELLEKSRPHLKQCRQLSIPLIDYRKYPILNKEEINRWIVFSKSRINSGGLEIDHVVRIVYICSGLIEMFYMSDNDIIKVEKRQIGCLNDQTKVPRNTFEIRVCCWYSKCKFLRELYLQLECESQGETMTYQGLSRYLRHYLILCSQHKCPEKDCKCCEYCKTHTWYENLNTSKRKYVKQDMRESPLIATNTQRHDSTLNTNELKSQKTASKSLIAKALAFVNNNNKNVLKDTNKNVTKQLQPNRGLSNQLLEIHHVNKNEGVHQLNKIEILEIGPNGELQSYVEKKKPDFIITGLVDTSKKKTTHEVCCWNRLQQVIDILKLQNVRPEVYKFIRQKHNCPTFGCNCCCLWHPSKDSDIFHMANVHTEPRHSKSMTRITNKISVKPINMLVERPVQKPTKTSYIGTENAYIGDSSFAAAPYMAPPVFTIQPKIQSDNVLDIRQVFIPTGAPTGHEVDSSLMQSIIDEEITRLIGETHGQCKANESRLEPIPSTSRSNGVTGELGVPQATEVNIHIKQILDKFKDLRLAVTPEGRVKVILSRPPDTPEDMLLLKNILQNIQSLLDQQTEKSDEVLARIIRQPPPNVHEKSRLVAPMLVSSAPVVFAPPSVVTVPSPIVSTNILSPLGLVYPVIVPTPNIPQMRKDNNSTQHALSSSVPVLAPKPKPRQKKRTMQVPHPIIAHNLNPQPVRNESNNFRKEPISLNAKLLAQETTKTKETFNLFEVLTRPPVPPKFSNVKDTDIQNKLQGSFTCLYIEPQYKQNEENNFPTEDTCLNNIKIAKVESIGNVTSPGNLQRKEILSDDEHETVVKRARLQLERLTRKRATPSGRSSLKASSEASPSLSHINTIPHSVSAFASQISTAGNAASSPVIISPGTSLPSSSVITTVPMKSFIDGIHSAAKPSSVMHVDVPTLQITQQYDPHNNSSISAETVLIPDDDDDDAETILGD